MASSISRTVRIVGQDEQPALSRAQKTFNKLIAKIEKQREKLAAWQAAIPLHQQKYDSEFTPLLKIYDQRRLELVHAFDQAYASKALSETDRARISDIICSIAAELIDDNGNEELKPIYNKHSGSNFDAEAEEDNRALKSMMESMLGIELGDDVDFSSREKMFANMHEQLKRKAAREEEKQQAHGERPSKRKKSAKQLEKEARLQAEEQDVSQSIREIFRKLASALHPDKEQDPVERQRKTALMQQVNVAYKNKDLLQLLELQLKIEQIDQATISLISEDRLKHYNKVLAEQSSELQRELDMIEFAIRGRSSFPPDAVLTPKAAMDLLQDQIEQIQLDIAALEHDLASCKNIKNIKRLLKKYQIAEDDPFADLDMDMLFKSR